MKAIPFNEVKHGKITEIYTGHESGCRCGCLGNYFEPGSRGFTRALNKITKLNPIVNMLEPEDDANLALALPEDGVAISNIMSEKHSRICWLDLCLPNDRTITLYCENLNA